ncbi:achaete-scute homolog 5 [Pteronotus mesoamericanus]|uniref:achaete-scute homolog 5 n=1 Tax=Pteronotus mesoamericanus TaxID=1884717 RepID=UPI0023EAD007|nr:achaete-scute homolog 5 [Pteronotus parnellii mesoamericanus]
MNGHFCRALMDRGPVTPPGAMQLATAPPPRPAPLPAEPSGAGPFLLFPGPAAAYAGLFPCAPGPGALGGYDCPFEPAFIHKRNERERHRVRCVNEGYARLRGHLPGALAERRLSKVETLRAAIRYIRHLQELLRAAPDGPRPERPSDAPPPEGPRFPSSPGLESEESSQ